MPLCIFCNPLAGLELLGLINLEDLKVVVRMLSIFLSCTPCITNWSPTTYNNALMSFPVYVRSCTA